MFTMFRDIRRILSPRFKWRALALVAGMAASSLLELAALGMLMPLATALAVPEMLETNRWLHALYELFGSPTRDYFILEIMVLILAVFVLKNVFAYLMTRAQTSYSADVSLDLTGRLYSTYVNADYSYHLTNGASELIAKISQIREIARLLLVPLLLTMSELCVFAAILLVVFILIPGIAFLSFAVCSVCAVLFHSGFKRLLNRASKQMHEAVEESTKTMNQSFAVVRELKLFGCGDFFREKLVNAQRLNVSALKLQLDFGQIPRYSLEVFVILTGAVFASAVILLHVPYDEIVLYSAFFIAAMFRLIPSVSRIQYNVVLMRGISYSFHVLCEDLTNIPTEKKAADDAPAITFDRELKLDHITFTYENAPAPVFRDFSLTIRPKGCIAVTGPTGGGKSTLTDLLMGFLKPESGKVLADGVDISQNLPAWRKLIGYVPQEINLFNDTIRANVAFGIPPEEIDDKRVAEVLEMAQMSDFTASLPEGTHTVIGEFGARLSGGQRQRIAIARALYRNPSFLILDEATSALDNDTEAAFIDALNALRGKLTILMVAHRSGCARYCNQVIRIGEKEGESV